MKQEITVGLSGGKKLHFENRRMAKQASGVVLGTLGESGVRLTADAADVTGERIAVFA